MSDKPYFEETQGAMLRSWVLGQMLSGAGFAAAFVILIATCLYAIWGIGLLLPEQSKQAPPTSAACPTPIWRGWHKRCGPRRSRLSAKPAVIWGRRWGSAS